MTILKKSSENCLQHKCRLQDHSQMKLLNHSVVQEQNKQNRN